MLAGPLWLSNNNILHCPNWI